MLYSIMRPSSTTESNPVFTRFGGLTQNLPRCLKRAERCSGRVYTAGGGSRRLVADYYVEPEPVAKLEGRQYWAARNQAASFV